MSHRADRPFTDRAVEDLVVLVAQARRVEYMAVLGHVLDDRLNRLVGVAQRPQRGWNRLVDDPHAGSADHLLHLHQREVGFDAGGVAVHRQPDRAGWGEQTDLRIAPSVLLAQGVGAGPFAGGQGEHPGVVRFDRADRVGRGGVLTDHSAMGVGVGRETVVGPDCAGELRGAPVGHGRHQGGDRGSHRPASIGVVRAARRHEKRAEVGVADPELTEHPGHPGDLRGREVGETDRDVHRGDDQLDGGDERLAVEGQIVAQEPHQVQRRQVATGVVQVHVLAARVAGTDPAGVRAGVPVIDRVVVLDPRIRAVPRGDRDRMEQRPRPDSLDDPSIEPGPQVEVGVVDHRPHELVRHPDRVVGVLVLHRDDVAAAEIHVEAGIPQCPDLAFLTRLGLDEVDDVGMVDVEHDHLRGSPGRTTRLDRSSRGVSAAHETDRSGRGAARGQQFLGRADARQVQAGTGPAFEDQTLFPVPVENRLHRVVDGEDETG